MKNHLISMGVDKLDQSYYRGKVYELNCCNRDAEDVFTHFSERYSFSSKQLFKDCHSTQFTEYLANSAQSLQEQDNLIIYYSGHGGQVKDLNGDETIDEYDETWCFYDKQLVDDEIFDALSDFKNGVNIIVLSDSCHSGSVIRDHIDNPAPNIISKKVGHKKSQELFELNEDLHKELFNLSPKGENDIQAHAILISGCQDDESSFTGNPNSQFTKALFQVLNETQHQINIKELYKRVKAILVESRYDQTPNFKAYGPLNTNFISSSLLQNMS